MSSELACPPSCGTAGPGSSLASGPEDPGGGVLPPGMTAHPPCPTCNSGHQAGLRLKDGGVGAGGVLPPGGLPLEEGWPSLRSQVSQRASAHLSVPSAWGPNLPGETWSLLLLEGSEAGFSLLCCMLAPPQPRSLRHPF